MTARAAKPEGKAAPLDPELVRRIRKSLDDRGRASRPTKCSLSCAPFTRSACCAKPKTNFAYDSPPPCGPICRRVESVRSETAHGPPPARHRPRKRRQRAVARRQPDRPSNRGRVGRKPSADRRERPRMAGLCSAKDPGIPRRPPAGPHG